MATFRQRALDEAASHKSERFYVEDKPVAGIAGVKGELASVLKEQKEPTVSLHCDKKVAVDEVVKVMNIAKDNGYRLILATQAK